MSILIKGMEMPKKCSDCRFVTWERGYVCLATSTPSSLRETISGKEKPGFCPLVPVPPHGDLIDAQEQMRLMQSCDYDTYDDYNKAFDMLDNAPTIIEADEADMDSFIRILKD